MNLNCISYSVVHSLLFNQKLNMGNQKQRVSVTWCNPQFICTSVHLTENFCQHLKCVCLKKKSFLFTRLRAENLCFALLKKKCYCINSMIQFTSDSAQVVAFVSFVGLAVLLIVEMV